MEGRPLSPRPIYGAFFLLKIAIYGGKRVQEVFYYHSVQVNCTQTAPDLQRYEARRGDPMIYYSLSALLFLLFVDK
jgi:hypothetical protein